MSSSFRFLCSADIHLGREVRLRKGLAERFDTREGWEALIDLACQMKGEIEAVLIAGDLIDRENFFYESVPIIKEGIDRLEALGIPLIAVTGNHDAEITGKICDAIASSHFVVLGRGGKWESYQLDCGVRVDGWSFPAWHHQESPFNGVPDASEGLCVGLVHTDWDGGEKSGFAPSSAKDLMQTAHQFWVFGHIHDPKVVHRKPLGFYAGSATPLDRNEQGARGAYLVEIAEEKEPELTFCPFAKLYFVTKNIQIESEGWQEQFEELLLDLGKEVSRSTELVALTLSLEGECKNYRKLRQWVTELEQSIDFCVFQEGREVPCLFQQIEERFSLAIDLNALSQGKDLIGYLARDLLALEGNDEKRREELIAKGRKEFGQLGEQERFFSSFRNEVDEDEFVAKQLHKAGLFSLHELLAQREVSGEA